jgi:hypothetical protein
MFLKEQTGDGMNHQGQANRAARQQLLGRLCGVYCQGPTAPFQAAVAESQYLLVNSAGAR